MIVPHAVWKATGDKSFFTDHGPGMTRFMEARKANDFRKQHLQPDGSIKPSSQSAYVLALAIS